MDLKYLKRIVVLLALALPCAGFAQTSPETKAEAAANLAAAFANPHFSGTSNLPNGWGLGTAASGDVSAVNVMATGGSFTRPLSQHFGDVIFARDRGIKCDGTVNGNGAVVGTDDTAAINSLLSNLPTGPANSFSIIFPSGICLFSSQITSGSKLYQVAIEGQGQGVTRFYYIGTNPAPGDLLYFQHSTLSKFQGFAIQSAIDLTGGCSLHVDYPNRNVFEDILIGTTSDSTGIIGSYNGLCISNPEITQLTDLNITSTNDTIASWGGGIGSGTAFGIWAQNLRLAAENGGGIHIGGGMDAVWFDNTMITESNYGIIDDQTLQSGDTFPENLRLYFGSNVTVDFPATAAILINNPGIDTAHPCPLNNPNPYYCGWSFNYDGVVQDSPSGATNAGVVIEAATQQSVHLGGRIEGINGPGVEIADASTRVFLDGEIDGNLTYGVKSLVANPQIFIDNPNMVHDNVTANFDGHSLAALNSGSLTTPWNDIFAQSITGQLGNFQPFPAAVTTLVASGNDAINNASNTSGESIPNNALTLVTGWTTQMDRVGTNWSASAGAFVAPATSPYSVKAAITFNLAGVTVPVGTTFKIEVVSPGVIACNGFPNVWPTQAAITGGFFTVSADCDVQGTQGQAIGVEAFQNSGVAIPLSTAAYTSYLSIDRIP